MTGPRWLVYVDLACAAVACGVWYAFPEAGPWPLLLALAPWVVWLWLLHRLPGRTIYDPLLVLFLLSAGVGVWAAFDRALAWQKFWLIAGGVLLFSALVRAEAIGASRNWLLAFMGAGVALYFLSTHDWAASEAGIEALARLGRALQAPILQLPVDRVNPNVAAGIMAMMFPFAGWAVVDAWRAVRQKRGSAVENAGAGLGWRDIAKRVLAVTLAALTLLGLLLTASRGAWIALGCALLLAALWWLLGRLGARVARQRVDILLALVGLLLLVVLVVALSRPDWLRAALNLMPGPDSDVSRVELLRNTLTLVRDYPVMGAGLGGYMMLYSTYSILLHVGFTTHSHNLLLGVAVEQGVPMALVLVGMWLLFVWVARGWLQSRGSAQDRLPVVAAQLASMSLAVLVVHGLVDNVLYGSRAVVLLFVPLALATRLPPAGLEGEGAGERPWLAMLRPLLVPLAIVLLALLALVWRRPILSRVLSNLGSIHQSQAELSIYSWPEWPIQDEVRRTVDLGRPIAEFERALELDPGNPTANRRLGMIELARGEFEAALRHLEAAHAAEPRCRTTWLLLGEAYIVNGRQAEGQALWARLPSEQGQLDNRVWWYGHIGEQERAGWLQQAAAAGR